jgi:hypothetical protein
MLSIGSNEKTVVVLSEESGWTVLSKYAAYATVKGRKSKNYYRNMIIASGPMFHIACNLIEPLSQSS